MSNFFSRKHQRPTSTRVLLESNEAGELAAHFQSENNLSNGQKSKGRSWWDFLGLKRGGVATKAVVLLLMLLFLLNVVITFVNWRSISSSTWIEKNHLDESNTNFSFQLKQLQAKFESNTNFSVRLEQSQTKFVSDLEKLKNATGKTVKVLIEQKKRLDASQNNLTEASNRTLEKFQDLEGKLEEVDTKIDDIKSNYRGATSNFSSRIQSTEDKTSSLRKRVDFFNRQIQLHQNQSHGENGTGNSTGIDFENLTPETRPRLEFTQEIWKQGKTGLVLAEEISPPENFQGRVEELRSKLEELKTEPQRFGVEDRKALFELLYNSSAIHGVNRTNVCGGAFNFSAPTTLRYEKLESDEGQKAQPCIWVIWADAASTIKLHMIHLNGELRIYNNFTLAQASRPLQTWTSDDFLGAKVVDTNVVVVVFTPSQDALADVMQLGLEIASPRPLTSNRLDVAVTELTVNSTQRTLSTTFAQSSTIYNNNERRFYVLYPPPGEKVRISFQKFRTEANYDFLHLFKYDTFTHVFTFLQQYTGTSNLYKLNVNYDGFEGQPILLYFHTDGSSGEEGFTATVRSVSL